MTDYSKMDHQALYDYVHSGNPDAMNSTAQAWQNSPACAGQTCTVEGYSCSVSFFLGAGGTHSGHITCRDGARVIRYDYHP